MHKVDSVTPTCYMQPTEDGCCDDYVNIIACSVYLVHVWNTMNSFFFFFKGKHLPRNHLSGQIYTDFFTKHNFPNFCNLFCLIVRHNYLMQFLKLNFP